MTKLNRQIERWLREIRKDIGPFDEQRAMQLTSDRIASGTVGTERKAIRQALEDAAREAKP